MASFLQYRDNQYNTGGWNVLAIKELINVEYTDEVYKPAQLKVTIQNASAGGGIAYSSIAHDGGAASSDDEIKINNTGHGLSDNARISITAESSGQIEAGVYIVDRIDANNFYVKGYSRNPWTGEKHQGGLLSREVGDGSTSGTLSYVPTGKYSIETVDVASPDFHMGQEVMWWHVPENYTLSGPYTHTGASPLVVSHSSHGFSTGDIRQFVDENTGMVLDGEYRVNVVNSNSYTLEDVKSTDAVNGNGTGGELSLYYETETIGFPLFYGTISSLEEGWSTQYGKIINLEAKDHLQFLGNTSAKKIMTNLRPPGNAEKMAAADGLDENMERIAVELPEVTYLDGVGYDATRDDNEDRFSVAVANIIDQFEEGAGRIYTDNGNRPNQRNNIGKQKFEESAFVLSETELKSGQFKKDISNSGHKILRVIQDIAMADRHVTIAGATRTSKTWEISSSWGLKVKVSNGAQHALSTGQTIAVLNSGTNAGQYIPNSYYIVEKINANDFYLKGLDNQYIVGTASSSTLDWEGAEDGNFGYDFYLDSGMYGIPTGKGYTVSGVNTNPRPHVNYFKRGYKQFRPDATGLNVTLPLAADTTETGQIRIMYPDASFQVGDDEVISDVELNVVDQEGKENKDASALGNNMQLLRVKKIQCKDNVDQHTAAKDRLAYGGRWLGDFHWRRHDLFTTAQSVHVNCALKGINDEAMFWGSGDSATSPGFSDSASAWNKADLGTAGGNYADGMGSAAHKEAVRRVLESGAGGVTITEKIAGAGNCISGYTGPSGIGLHGRTISGSPAKRATAEEFHDIDKVKREFPDFYSGIVDCDLIKSIKNCEDEELYSANIYSTNSTYQADGSGNLLVTHNPSGSSAVPHYMASGGWIRIESGPFYDSNNYWNNYKRVEMAGVNPSINTSAPGKNLATTFYLTNLPYEAYEGIIEDGGTIPSPGAYTKMTTSVSTATAFGSYRRVYNVFDGVCRVQYQGNNTRNEASHTDSYVLISDRQRIDSPYMGVDQVCFAGRESSNGYVSGMPEGTATMPDSFQYSADEPGHVIGLEGGVGRYINQAASFATVPVRFRKGDKISETRFLMRDEGNASSARCWFKNTQAIITHSLMEDKKRAKTQSITYSTKGNDFNEVRRVCASLLTRSSKDLIRGDFSILEYPFIKLTGQAQSGSSGAVLMPTQTVVEYGGRAGMLVTKTDTLDGVFQGGVLAEHINDDTGAITGTLSDGTWSHPSPATYYRMYIHLRAGHSVRVVDPRSSVSSNMLATKIQYTEAPNNTRAKITVIGYKDLPTGVPVRPLGNIAKAVVDNKGDVAGPITLAKARLKDITFVAGEE